MGLVLVSLSWGHPRIIFNFWCILSCIIKSEHLSQGNTFNARQFCYIHCLTGSGVSQSLPALFLASLKLKLLEGNLE